MRSCFCGAEDGDRLAADSGSLVVSSLERGRAADADVHHAPAGR